MVHLKDSILGDHDTNDIDVEKHEAWLVHICQHRTLDEQAALTQAYELAKRVHYGQKRASGEPYLIHILQVADILADLHMDTEVLIASILRGVLKHSRYTLTNIQQMFGNRVSVLVKGANKMRLPYTGSHQSPTPEQRYEQLRRIIMEMAKDPRVLLIQLANRLQNMRTLKYLPAEQQRRFAQETLELFAPLANRLGIWQIKWELEDLALRYTQPEAYKNIAKQLDERRIDRENYINNIINVLQEALHKRGITAEVYGRPKHIYSIWRKMQRKNIDFAKVFDLRAIRVLVKEEAQCYQALGIVHKKWRPVPHEFDDYIASPKMNHYQSLHTAVYGPENKIFEVQIRTQEMHQHAEFGIAAHWMYKEDSTEHDSNFQQKIAFLRQIVQLKEEVPDPREFVDHVKSEITEERIYALTPTHEVIDLPKGATPIDFAYYIHTSIGHRCRDVRINSKHAKLNTPLQTGDRVEIITGNEERPIRAWLCEENHYVQTSRARNQIRQWFRQQDRATHIKMGRKTLERELQRLNLNAPNLDELAQKFNYKNADGLLAALGCGDLSVIKVVNQFKPQILPKRHLKIPTAVSANKEEGQGVHVRGVDGLMVKMAGCCHPIPPEPIVGYISVGRGVIVHRQDCTSILQRLDDERSERLVEVTWGSETENDTYNYSVDIQIIAVDRKGLLLDIGMVAMSEDVSILEAHTSSKDDNTAVMNLTVEVKNVRNLSRLLAKLDSLPNIVEVSRKVG